MTTQDPPVLISNTVDHQYHPATATLHGTKDSWLQKVPKIVTSRKDECGFVTSTSTDSITGSHHTSKTGPDLPAISVNSSALPSSSTSPKTPKSRLKFHKAPFIFTKSRTRGASKAPTRPNDSNASSGALSSVTTTLDDPHPVVETSKMVVNYDATTGYKVINKYMIIKEIGRGCHGKVKLCQDVETGTYYAIKIVEKHSRRRLGQKQSHPSSLDKIRKEIAILKRCNHPNVVRLYEVIDDPEAKKIYLVLEYADGGELRWRDRSDQPILSLEKSRRIFRDVVLGLEYLHYQGIIHRDIKPANLLCTKEAVVKISDFGVSYSSRNRNSVAFQPHLFIENSRSFGHSLVKDVRSNPSLQSISEDDNGESFPVHTQMSNDTESSNDPELAKTAGSPAFFAPELCYSGEEFPDPALDHRSPRTGPLSPKRNSRESQRSLSKPPITKAIDVWALGITLYCLVFGRCPFMAETEYELFHLIPQKPLEFPAHVIIPDSLKELLSRLLEKQPLQRITLEEVKRHPWVIEDLPDPEQWYQDTSPWKHESLESIQVKGKPGVSLKDRIKGRMRKISSSILHVGTSLGFRRRPKPSPE
ncbi:kinase-like protein [Basidiobolus meristosporus CBS 931.73]|uniref:non-specific serine/threonine protein kinase n=1 Tax=Basidiobolus meristosporus CBS 931.73 TaxID=1314790 RepID=A0A1Y1YBS0_9FUNG|nr:kinase-like protein [Basidiobolus meristosporus CBS 931.73]|eukprot:ORX95383.1 kinase-like protein [Basidiobolus meristosporus CBS 931.73]